MDDSLGYGSVTPFRPSATLVEPGYRDEESATHPEIDFGPLWVRVPPDAGVRMSVEDEPYSDAVYFDFPNGTVRLSLFAAPRSSPLWPVRAEEIAGAQAGIGAQVSSVWGDWGRELNIVHNGEYNWVIGVDGSRWMLMGRASWTTESGWELVEVMRSMIRHSRVERGAEPMPVRAPLSLRRPGAADEEHTPDPDTPYAARVTMRQEAPPAEVDDSPSAVALPEPLPDDRPGPAGAAVLPVAEAGRSPITLGRGLAAAAAVLAVIAGSLWLTREDPAVAPAAPAALPAGPAPAAPALPMAGPTPAASTPLPAGPAPAAPLLDDPANDTYPRRMAPVPPAARPPVAPVRTGQPPTAGSAAAASKRTAAASANGGPGSVSAGTRSASGSGGDSGERSARSGGDKSGGDKSGDGGDRSGGDNSGGDRSGDGGSERSREAAAGRPAEAVPPSPAPLDGLGQLPDELPHQLLRAIPGF